MKFSIVYFKLLRLNKIKLCSLLRSVSSASWGSHSLSFSPTSQYSLLILSSDFSSILAHAATTKYHKLNDSTRIHLFLTVIEARKPKIEVMADVVVGGPYSWLSDNYRLAVCSYEYPLCIVIEKEPFLCSFS